MNPFDLEGVADTIRRACLVDESSRRSRMEKMRRSIQRQDIFHWVNAFLQAGAHKDLNQFPRIEFFVPKAEDQANRHSVADLDTSFL